MFTHKHDLDRIKKSKNDEKEEVEVETSHLEKRSSIRQGKMLLSVRLNEKRKSLKQIRN